MAEKLGLEALCAGLPRQRDRLGTRCRSSPAEDLKDLGVVLGGHRRKLLDAIAALGTALPAASVTAPSRDAPGFR